MAKHNLTFRSQYDYNFKDNREEFFSSPSLTQQDQSYTIREMLAKFVNGIPLSLSTNLNGDYDDENINFENFDETRTEGFDAIDAQRIINSLTARINEHKESQAENTTAEGNPESTDEDKGNGDKSDRGITKSDDAGV